MTLTDILTANGINAEVANAIMAAMRENKIFTSSEENLDIRYGKLKTDHDSTVNELKAANGTIEELRKASKGQADLQGKIDAYDKQVAQLQQDLADARFDAEAKLGLMTAKAVDVDYLLFKLKENLKANGKEAKLDETGKIPDWGNLLSGLQTQSPKMFEAASEGDAEGYQVLNPNKLKNGEHNDLNVSKEQFHGMSYEERLKLKTNNPEQFKKLAY